MRTLIDYSRSGEPLIFGRFIRDSAPRVVIDVHAGDGMTGSLSRQLIDEGWRALLIEPDPKLFAELCHNTKGLDQVQLEREIRADGLTNALEHHAIPNDVGLMLLNDAKTGFEILRTLDTERFRPRVIVTNDGPAVSDARSRKYDLLSSAGYVYSGLAGEYSTWRLASEDTPHAATAGAGRLPLFARDASGEASFDPLPGEFETATTIGPREVMVSGWAFANAEARVPPLIWIEILDRTSGRGEYVQAHRYWRPEVATRFKRRNLLMSGFRALVPVSGKRPKSLSLRIWQADDETLYRSGAELLLETQLQQYEQVAREGLARKFLSGGGIEIGALQRPLAMPRGCQVRYVDRISLDELRSHYPELGQFPLQSPDFLDDGETLSRIASSSQDFVIANHFFEHSENPIQTLRNLLRVIKRGGILYMGLPDKQYTFDFERPVTRYDVLKQTYKTGMRADRERLFEEWVTLAERRTGEDARLRIAELIATNYSIHYNVWTLDDLLEFLINARRDFALPFHMASVVCCDNEAIALLERTEP